MDDKPVESVNTTTAVPASDVSEMTGVPASAKPAPTVGSKVDPGSIKQVQPSTVVLDGKEFNFLQKE